MRIDWLRYQSTVLVVAVLALGLLMNWAMKQWILGGSYRGWFWDPIISPAIAYVAMLDYSISRRYGAGGNMRVAIAYCMVIAIGLLAYASIYSENPRAPNVISLWGIVFAHLFIFYPVARYLRRPKAPKPPKSPGQV